MSCANAATSSSVTSVTSMMSIVGLLDIFAPTVHARRCRSGAIEMQ